MNLRVPTSSLYTRLAGGLGASLSRVQQLQSQVSSGQRITKLSDDPIGATTGLRLRAQETDWGAYQRTADDASAILGTADAALQSATNLISKVKNLAISAMNGAYGPSERKAISEEIGQVHDQLVDVANTQYLGRAVFGGHNAVAIRKDTLAGPRGADWPWSSNTAAPVSRQISPAVTIDANIDGIGVFGQGDDSVFAVLKQLQSDVASGVSSGIVAGQGLLDARFDAVTRTLGEVGALQNRIEAATELGSNILSQVRSQRSQVEDIDLAEAMMRLNAAATGYQASLAAIAKGDLPSLASFLR